MLRVILIFVLMLYSIVLAYKARLDYQQSKSDNIYLLNDNNACEIAKEKLKESNLILTRANEQLLRVNKDL